MYTGQITFAALSSQDVTPAEKGGRDGCSQGERKSPRDSEGLSAPSLNAVVIEPCSPKSVYSLANKVRLAPLRRDTVTHSSSAQVGLAGLCDLALEDIRSKLDKNNIVHELFSPFTAR